jgi:hypothetical protein
MKKINEIAETHEEGMDTGRILELEELLTAMDDYTILTKEQVKGYIHNRIEQLESQKKEIRK